MTSYNSSTAIAYRYMASSLPYNAVLPGPSGSYLIVMVGTHSVNHIHILCQCNLIQELETSEFSCPLIGQHRIGHLITLTPLTLRPSFIFASVQEISAFAMGAVINLTKRQTLHISVCSIKSGTHTHHPQRIYLIQHLEMLIIMQTQHAS